MKKKVIIFEGLKGSGKTILINALKNNLKNSVVFGEEVTLKPIKHENNKKIITDYYKEIINKIDNIDSAYFLLDRFYYSKWQSVDYERESFIEVEKLLTTKFETSLVFLQINDDSILQRLRDTENRRKATGWKLNYDGLSVEDEAKKDSGRQRFFLEHRYIDTIIEKRIIINTTDLPKNMDNLDIYLQKIIQFINSKSYFEDIQIQESNKFSNLLKYLNILIKEKLYGWTLYVLLVKIFGGKNSRLVILKSGKEIIGGFLITTFPLPKYKPYNWFRSGTQNAIKILIQRGYKYFCCFIIKKDFRNKGIGKMVFDEYLKKNHEKLWFTSSVKARSFYTRNGAKVFYKSKYDIYTLN